MNGFAWSGIARALTPALVLLLPVLPACGGPRGRAAAARAACGIGASGESDPVARQIALARCDAQYESRIAQVDRAEAYERQASYQRAQVRQARAQSRSSQLAAIRARPQSPELGGTVREGEQLCERQHGRYRAEGEGLHVCRVGGRVLFGGRSSDGSRFHEVVTFFEGADSAAFRDIAIERMGAPRDERVVRGFRVWRWLVDGAVLTIGGYEHGAAVSWASRPE